MQKIKYYIKYYKLKISLTKRITCGIESTLSRIARQRIKIQVWINWTQEMAPNLT